MASKYDSSSDYRVYQNMKNTLDEYKQNASVYNYINNNYKEVVNENTKLSKEGAFYEESPGGREISSYTAERMATYGNEKMAYIEKLNSWFSFVYYVLCTVLLVSNVIKRDLKGVLLSCLFFVLPYFIYIFYLLFKYLGTLFVYIWKSIDLYSSYSSTKT